MVFEFRFQHPPELKFLSIADQLLEKCKERIIEKLVDFLSREEPYKLYLNFLSII